MAKTVYEATAPDGTVITRTTDRVYTHAVLAKERKGTRGWGYIGFCGSLELAQKLERTTSARYKKYDLDYSYVLVPAVPRSKPPRN